MSGRAGQQTTKPTEVVEHYTEDFLESMDGRYRTARTLRQRLRALTADLGGAESLSYMERSLCKRFVHLERQIERKELSLAHGGSVEEPAYLNGINVLIGIGSKLGYKRRPKVVGTLAELLSQQQEPTC